MSPDPNFDLISDPDATPAPAMVQLTLAAAPRQVEPAGVVTYTVVITNTLADRALGGLVVSDTLPLELAYWPAGEGDFSYLETERRLEWVIGQLAAGATLTGTFQAQALGAVSGQVITNTVAIVSEEVGAGVQASAAITITAAPCLGEDCAPTPTAEPPTATPTVEPPPCQDEECTPTPTATEEPPTATPTATVEPPLCQDEECTPTPTATWTPTATPLSCQDQECTPTPTPGPDEVWLTPGEGGVLHSADGRVQVEARPGAVRQPTQLRYRSLPAVPADGLIAVFALEATPPDGDFGQPVSLRVRITAAEASRGLGELRLLTWDEQAGDWRASRTTAEPATGSLATTVFSAGVYAAASSGPTYGVTILPSLKAFTSDLWSGAASVGYDLDVPAGPAGLGVGLRLAYNSQGSNILGQVAGSAYQAQASWVGLGWDLAGIGSISRPLGKTGPYNLSFGGGAFEIKQSGGVLTTDPQGFLKIEHSDGLAWNTQPWTVRTPDGMKYTFGNPAGGVGGGTAYEAFWTGWGQGCGVRATQWGLTRIEDPAGNRWDIAWAHETKGVSNGCTGNAGQYTRASYPETLTLTPKNGAATVRVRLVREPRNDKNVCKYSDPYQINSFGDGRLKQVFVEAYTAAGAWQLVRRYDLGYTYDSTTLGCGTDPGSGNHSLLTSITQYGSNGASALPAYTFGYQGSGNSVRLRTANNGYGGAVQFNYSPEFVGNNAGCTSYQWQVVTSQVITNGAASGLGLFSTTEYAPTGAYAYVTPVGCNNGAEIPRDTYEFLGHTAVQEVAKDAAGQAVTQRNHSYSYQYNASAGKPDPRKGKETLVITTQPGGGELARTATGWLLQTVGGVDWPYTSAVTQTQGSAVAVTRYAYAIANQGGSKQYGNVTHIREYANATDTTPYRTTERWYYPRDDASAYIVNRVAQEKLWAGDSGGACQSQTRQIYDTTGFNQQQTPPTKGQLKEVWQAKTCDSANQSDWVRPAVYSYDLYGNRTGETNAAGATTTTTYDATFKTYPVTQITTPGAGGGATLTTSNTYYGVSGAEANGSGLVGQLQRSTDANSAAIRLTYDVFGRVTEIRKPGAGWANPATEKYAYTDSPAPLAVRHSLRDDQNGDASGTVTYLDDWAFYDGLGQVIQTQQEAASDSQSIVASTQYHPLGGVKQQNAPYFYAAAGGAYRPPDWGQAKTQTTYDALGRPLVVTQPDSSTTETRYAVEYNPADPDFSAPRPVVYTIDANRRFVRRASDVFGNLRSVSESTGSWPVGQPNPTWGSEYRTRYSYDVAGRLLTVQDHASNQTTLTHDLLGRKTSMNDPDMGAWQYRYDAAGNLVKQRDARYQAICFYYDGHNRLVGKTYHAGISNLDTLTCSGAYAVSFSYDSTANGNLGKGRRTGMNDPSGSSAWAYDLRGRVITETQVISGTGGGAFVTAWRYDSADRPLWQKYPGGNAGQVGEQVNFTYTTQGLLRQVRSNGSTYYVGETLYNALGQTTQRWLGSTTGVVQQLYTYTAAENFRLVTLKTGNASPYTNLQNISYTYDDVGNVLTITDAAAYGGSQTQTFAYDALHRLSTAQASGTPPNYGAYSQKNYGYNAIGNLTHFESATQNQYYQDAAHKHAVTHIGGTAPGNQKYWYDQNGNATRRISGSQDITLSYDAENRLTAMSGGVTSSYVYDGDGTRVKETISGATRAFVGSYYEVDNGVVKKYYYAGSVRVAESSGSTLYYLLTDHLGSTALTLNSSGVRQTELRYYPFGAARYNANNQVTTYRFTGQRWDSGTALYFYQSRWYDPLIGRFLAADTIVPQPENPQNLNRYSYCGSNPLKYVDSSGHNAIEFWGGAGGGGGVAFLMAMSGLAQSVSQQAQSLTVQMVPTVNQLAQTWYVHGNSIIAAADQLSQAAQNASQAGNTADPGRFDPNDPRFREVVDRAKEAKVTIEPGKLDFLLGKVSTPGTIEKSAQRGIDFGQKLGYTEGGLSKALMEQARNFDAVSQVRISKLGNPLVNFESIVTGPSGLQAKLISSWELKDGVLRLVTSWAEILK